jgi:hypothetical protein
MPLKLVRYLSRCQDVFETTGTDDRAAAEAIRKKEEGPPSLTGPLAAYGADNTAYATRLFANSLSAFSKRPSAMSIARK